MGVCGFLSQDSWAFRFRPYFSLFLLLLHLPFLPCSLFSATSSPCFLLVIFFSIPLRHHSFILIPLLPCFLLSTSTNMLSPCLPLIHPSLCVLSFFPKFTLILYSSQHLFASRTLHSVGILSFIILFIYSGQHLQT